MKVLVVNDDGIFSNNLKVLVNYLKNIYDEIMVLAPSTEQSAMSHRINIKGPIKLTIHDGLFEGVKAYSIDSTPADCVKFAVDYLKYDFDILFSGINDGLNLADDISYSGTVAAVLEANYYNKKGIALSVLKGQNEGILESLEIFMQDYLKNAIYAKFQAFNVNLPLNPKGIQYVPQGKGNYEYYFTNEGNNIYIPRIRPKYQKRDIIEHDLDAYYNGYISVTPLTVDKTDYQVLNKINNK